jgi:hypothetical protein
MFTFDSLAASADKLFGAGFLTDVYFDLHAGESNILIAARYELVQWIRNQAKMMATDVGGLLETGDTETALMVSQTVTELAENLTAIDNLDSNIGYIVFHDGKLFKAVRVTS